MGVYLTHGPSGPNHRPKGPKGQPAGHVLCWFGPRLRGHVSIRGVEGHGGGESRWMSLHPAGHHLAPNRLLQVGGAPPQPYK
jgi:hypothetical protein